MLLETVAPPVFGKGSRFLNARFALGTLLTAFLLALILVPAGTGCNQAKHDSAPAKLRVATTTSLYDSGLWEYLEPLFEARYGIDLEVLYAGTGIALRYGEKGDVDAIVTHDPDREALFISQGYGLERVPFACSRFLVVGPADDPARIKGQTPEAAFARIAAIGSVLFISRGDESGTHIKEKEIWQRAGFDYEEVRRSRWYIEAGRGMGPTLLLAAEKRGYALTDKATFVTYGNKLGLVPLVDQGDILLNTYSILLVDPKRYPWVNYEASKRLAEFLVTEEVQTTLREFGTLHYGEPLFLPYCDCARGLLR